MERQVLQTTVWINNAKDNSNTTANYRSPVVQTFEDDVLSRRFEYITTYMIAIVVVLALVLYRSFGYFKMCLCASRNIHDHLFRGITRGWMSFFNTNPSGRILNRFSKDIDNIDNVLPIALNDGLLVRL